MDHSAETPSSDRVRLFATTLTHAELPAFLQKNHKSIQKLEISHSNIDPKLFKNLPAGLKKLSLTCSQRPSRKHPQRSSVFGEHWIF